MTSPSCSRAPSINLYQFTPRNTRAFPSTTVTTPTSAPEDSADARNREHPINHVAFIEGYRMIVRQNGGPHSILGRALGDCQREYSAARRAALYLTAAEHIAMDKLPR